MYISMYIVMYISMYIVMYINMHISMYIVMYIVMFISMYIVMYIVMFISMFISMYINIFITQKKKESYQRYDLIPRDFSVFIDTYFLSIEFSYLVLSAIATFNINRSYSSLTTNLRVCPFSRLTLDLRSVK